MIGQRYLPQATGRFLDRSWGYRNVVTFDLSVGRTLT